MLVQEILNGKRLCKCKKRCLENRSRYRLALSVVEDKYVRMFGIKGRNKKIILLYVCSILSCMWANNTTTDIYSSVRSVIYILRRGSAIEGCIILLWCMWSIVSRIEACDDVIYLLVSYYNAAFVLLSRRGKNAYRDLYTKLYKCIQNVRMYSDCV